MASRKGVREMPSCAHRSFSGMRVPGGSSSCMIMSRSTEATSSCKLPRTICLRPFAPIARGRFSVASFGIDAVFGDFTASPAQGFPAGHNPSRDLRIVLLPQCSTVSLSATAIPAAFSGTDRFTIDRRTSLAFAAIVPKPASGFSCDHLALAPS